MVNNELSFLGGTRRITSNYLLRDQYGQLHYYKDNDNRTFGGLSFDVGTIDLFAINLPLFNLKLGASQFTYHMKDYVMKLPEQDRDLATDLLSDGRRAKEYLALKDLSKAIVDIDSSELAELNYSVDAKGTANIKGLGLLFL